MKPTYWYAPFDNAGEMALARAIAPKLDSELIVHSCESRFGRPLPIEAGARFTLHRELPPPAGEGGGSRSPLSRWQVAKKRADLRRDLVRLTRPGLVHLHTYNIFTDWFEIGRLKRLGAPVIQSIHNVRPQESTLPSAVEHRLLRRGYRALDHIIVAHQRLAEWLIDDFAIGPEKISVVPLPVQSEEFDANRHPPEDGLTTFLFFGTLRRNKGVDHYLRAIESLRVDDGLRFVFAGRGDGECEEAICAAARVDPRISTEIGYVENPRRAELYALADVIVMPYTELPAQSGVLQDAYAAGRPVISTNVGALGPTVIEEQTGWVVPPSDVGALAQVMRDVAAGKAERGMRADNARHMAEARSPERIADRLVDVYQNVSGPRPAGGGVGVLPPSG